MTHHSRLEEAIEYRDRLTNLLVFKRGLESSGTSWRGSITISFGSYEAELSMGCEDVFGLFGKALDAEERQLRNSLEILGVKYGSDPLS
jgi:hypothetical protein